MMRQKLLVTCTAAAVALVGAAPAFALSPGTQGQPGESCGSATALMSPQGFNTTGFTDATIVYAGSEGTPSLANGSPTAVSQYDVACFEVSAR